MPLIAWHFNQINFWSIPAGVAILPLAVIALVAGLGKILLSAAWPSALACGPRYVPLRFTGSRCRSPHRQIPRRHRRRRPAPLAPRPLLRPHGRLLLPPLQTHFPKAHLGRPIPCFATFTIWPAASAPASTTGDLQITLLSLGAGQCGIIRLPSGHAVFIDAGSSLCLTSREYTRNEPRYARQARIAGDDAKPWNSRGHFFGAAAEAMRRILVENARRKARIRHAGGLNRIDLDRIDLAADEASDELLALNDALDRLAEEEPTVAEVVKLRHFAGLTIEQTAAALGISVRTANRHWAYARAWLYQQLNPPDGTTDERLWGRSL